MKVTMKPPDTTRRAYYWVKCRQKFRVDAKPEEWWEPAEYVPTDGHDGWHWLFTGTEWDNAYEVIQVGEELKPPEE